MLKDLLIISALILSFFNAHAQLTFECENDFYLSEHSLDTLNEATNLYKVSWINNVLDFELIAQYGVTANSIALNPFDGLIYGFNIFTQEIIRLYPTGQFDNLGKVTGLEDLGFFHSGGTFDDLGRYILTGHNQFISTIDVSCDTVILIQQLERFSNDASVFFTFFSDVAFHPKNGLLYGYDSPSRRLAIINLETGLVEFNTQVNDENNMGALFFDDDANLFGYEDNNFYGLSVETGVVDFLERGVSTEARDGCSCLNVDSTRIRYKLDVQTSACERSATLTVCGLAAVTVIEYHWFLNGLKIENATTESLVVDMEGLYRLDIRLTNYCGDEIHRESHEHLLTFPRAFGFESFNISHEFCSSANGEIMPVFHTDFADVSVVINNTSMLDVSNQGLSAGIYHVQATSAAGCNVDTTIELVNTICDIYVPNAFSPNNDGINDDLRILSSSEARFSVIQYEVYNRWGGKIYAAPRFEHNSNSHWWNGRVSDSPLDSDVFVLVYTIEWPDDRLEFGTLDVILLK